MYCCYLFLKERLVCEVRLKSITKVCKFLDTVDFEILNCRIYSPKGNRIDPISLLEVWNA